MKLRVFVTGKGADLGSQRLAFPGGFTPTREPYITLRTEWPYKAIRAYPGTRARTKTRLPPNRESRGKRLGQ
jgi:hypothetical protein